MPYTQSVDFKDIFSPVPMLAACRRTTGRVGEKITEGARDRSPVHVPPPGQPKNYRGDRPPGTLKESWRTGDVDTTATVAGTPRFIIDSYTEDPIAPHVEYDTQPHIIRPRADRAAASVIETGKPRRKGTDDRARLRFINRFGQVVYAAEVHHPGTTGQHMMRDSLADANATWAMDIGEEEMGRWSREQTELIH